MTGEEEAMELSGESNLVSNLHNFSFDVSWSTTAQNISPNLHRRSNMLAPSRTNILSPARFNVASTPLSRGHKPLHYTTPGRSVQTPTVKLSHKSIGTYHDTEQPIRRQSFSPMELDQSDNSFGFKSSPPQQITKRHSDFGISYLGDKTKTTPSLKKITEDSPVRKRNINNNLSYDFELENTVFETDRSGLISPDSSKLKNGVEHEKQRRKKKRNKMPDTKKDVNKSGVVLIIVVMLSICMGVYLFMQVGSCSVFDIDIVKLRHKLEDNVFGQHIAVKTVIEALEKFEREVKNGEARSSLALSFHGWTGIGKNYVSKFITEAFFNARVFLYLIPLHFSASLNTDGVNRQNTKIKSWIVNNVTKCGVNVFIFDEMDKANDDVIQGIQSAIETLDKNKQENDKVGQASPLVVILFLSNARSTQINQYLFSQIVVERHRELIKREEFDSIFNKTSSEWYESLKSKHQIDYFVPFLPLAESHVRQCIERDFVKKGRNPGAILIESVMEELSFFDMGGQNGQVSLTGCKRVQDKVDLHIDD